MLFVDCDGCLHPDRFVSCPGRIGEGLPVVETRLPRRCQWVPILERLLAPHEDVGIVIYSSWRYIHSHRELVHLLGPLASRYLGVTPAGRSYESVSAWLKNAAGVGDYRVLDATRGDMAKPAPQKLITCDPRSGISSPEVQEQLQAWLWADPWLDAAQ
ncbi:HAD domain-containing protein [Aquabacterium sp. A7-Y]|uniref:HAD domain-containing protein n=1 Tax=Aquabacterium sp. A7-Y TaxID=1349605 RepID=UPI00223DD416|nr:HAD domain-containing protein [Aquabacterium sp. A7-Y]MCW7540888.1 HAD domain-containing protein [Aquabacterium sp. A7-Y]